MLVFFIRQSRHDVEIIYSKVGKAVLDLSFVALPIASYGKTKIKMRERTKEYGKTAVYMLLDDIAMRKI